MKYSAAVGLMPALLCCALAVAADPAPSPSESGDEGQAMKHVEAEIGFDRGAVVPGGSATVGIRFIIEDGWHLYWRNNGDSGMPISVTFEAPEGVRIGSIQWPAPERHVYGDGSLDYIYEHEVALLAGVEIDERFAVGDQIEIKASFELLACKEACVFGMGERVSVIGIAESGSMSVPEWMKKNRARIPRRVDLGDQIRWDGTDLLISVYSREGITGVRFYPFDPVEIRPINPVVDGTSETGTLRIAYPVAITGEPRVAGVLEVNARESAGSASLSWIEIETTPPAANADEGGANEPTPPHTPPTNESINNRSGD